jgi:hypothetical protein
VGIAITDTRCTITVPQRHLLRETHRFVDNEMSPLKGENPVLLEKFFGFFEKAQESIPQLLLQLLYRDSFMFRSICIQCEEEEKEEDSCVNVSHSSFILY